MLKIISRAVNEFSFDIDNTASFQNVYKDACDFIVKRVKYDRIEECEMDDDCEYLSWSDGMGYYVYDSIDSISDSVRAKNIGWARKGADGTFAEIDSTDADPENDYKFCHTVLDSEGNCVQLVCKYTYFAGIVGC